MEELKCKICGKEFERYVSLANHIFSKHRIKSEDYYIKYIDINSGICKYCGNKTSFISLKRGFYKACGNCKSSHFKGKTYEEICGKYKAEKLKKIRSNNIKKYFSNENNRKKASEKAKNRPIIKCCCMYCNREYSIRTIDQHQKSKSCPTSPRSGEYKGRDISGDKNPMKKLEVQRKVLGKVIHTSKPQLTIYKLVKYLYPSCKLEYNSLKYWIDIAIPNKNIAIEYNDPYWHQDKEADLKRQKELENIGWRFIRYIGVVPNLKILEHDINQLIKGGNYGRKSNG